MRSIKFKGIRVDNGTEIIGSLITDSYLHGEKYYDARIMPWPLLNTPYEWYQVVPTSVRQFTGILGANNKELYEGDTVTFFAKALGIQITGTIVYNQDACSYHINFKKENKQYYHPLTATFSDGDIWTNDNIELL